MNLTKKLIAGAAIAGMLAPAFMFAQTATTTAAPSTSSSPQTFCLNVDVIANRVYSVMVSVQATYKTARNTAVANTAYGQADALVAKGTADAYAQALNNKIYVTLSAKARTQEQKDALTAFKTTYDKASADLKAATSLAFTTYKTAVNKILSSRNTQLNDAIMAYTTAINTAIAKAKADCKSGVDSTTAYNAFSTSVKEANATFAKNSKMNDMRAAIEPLNQTLKTSINAAVTAYKAVVKPAWTALATAFKVPTTTSSQDTGTVAQ